MAYLGGAIKGMKPNDFMGKRRGGNEVEDLFLQRIMYIGDAIPATLANDGRRKFVLLGNPIDLINEILDLITEPYS
jgi:hypothetical protein